MVWRYKGARRGTSSGVSEPNHMESECGIDAETEIDGHSVDPFDVGCDDEAGTDIHDESSIGKFHAGSAGDSLGFQFDDVHEQQGFKRKLMDADIGDTRRDSSWKVLTDRVTAETSMDVGGRSSLKFPWECGAMSLVFGGELQQALRVKPIFPPEPPVFSNNNEQPVEDIGSLLKHASPAYLAVAKTRRLAVSKTMTCNREVILKKWRSVFYHNIDASSVGQQLQGLGSDVEQLGVLEEVFAGKSDGTLSKRVNSLTKFVQFLQSQHGQDYVCIPFRSHDVLDYMRWLKICSKFSCMRDFSQALLFAEHVAGLGTEGYMLNPSVKGLVRESYFHRDELKQSRALSVKEVMRLESALIGGACHEIDCYFAGIILFMLYGRARVSDVRGISWSCVDKSDGADGVGYVEMRTFDHKGSRRSRASGIPLILLAPAFGLCEQSWGYAFIRVANKFGFDFSNGFEGPILQTLDSTGRFTGQPMKTDDATKMINTLIRNILGSVGPGLTSHGIKATVLTWCAKYGMSEDDRHVLGGHSISGKKTMFGYSRDFISAPVRRMEGMIDAIRQGIFRPDSTRSGMIRRVEVEAGEQNLITDEQVSCPPSPSVVAPGDVIKIDDDWIEVKDEGSPVHLVDDSFEVIGDESDSDSSSSSDSSDSSDSDDIERADNCRARTSRAPWPPAFEWRFNCTVYKHKRTSTLHLLPSGGKAKTFVCGRRPGADHEVFDGSIHAEDWKCRQCDSGRPIRDVDSLVKFFDRK